MHSKKIASEYVSNFLAVTRSKQQWDEIAALPLLDPKYNGEDEALLTPLQQLMVKGHVDVPDANQNAYKQFIDNAMQLSDMNKRNGHADGRTGKTDSISDQNEMQNMNCNDLDETGRTALVPTISAWQFFNFYT